jgi:hypothetical protein
MIGVRQVEDLHMNGGTRSTFVAVALVAGLALTVVGGLLCISNPPISENAAIDKAARTTVGPKGQKMYEITDGEIRQALAQRRTANATREGRTQTGEAIAVAGLILLGAGGLAVLLAPTGAVRQPDQPRPEGTEKIGDGRP